MLRKESKQRTLCCRNSLSGYHLAAPHYNQFRCIAILAILIFETKSLVNVTTHARHNITVRRFSIVFSKKGVLKAPGYVFRKFLFKTLFGVCKGYRSDDKDF